MPIAITRHNAAPKSFCSENIPAPRNGILHAFIKRRHKICPRVRASGDLRKAGKAKVPPQSDDAVRCLMLDKYIDCSCSIHARNLPTIGRLGEAGGGQVEKCRR
jgi:hypothetical protein